MERSVSEGIREIGEISQHVIANGHRFDSGETMEGSKERPSESGGNGNREVLEEEVDISREDGLIQAHIASGKQEVSISVPAQ